MTDEELKEIELRAAKATPGPWWAHERDGDWQVAYDDDRYGYPCDIAVSSGYDGEIDFGEDNAIFIAHARLDISKLITEVRRLRQQTLLAAVAMLDTEQPQTPAGRLAWAQAALGGDVVNERSEND